MAAPFASKPFDQGPMRFGEAIGCGDVRDARELGPVGAPTALDFHHLGRKLRADPRGVARHGRRLGFETEAARTLSVGGNAIVCDETEDRRSSVRV